MQKAARKGSLFTIRTCLYAVGYTSVNNNTSGFSMLPAGDYYLG